MAAKRTAEDEAQSRAPKNKRQKTTRIDPTSGQRGAFGDLEDATTAPAGDSDLDCEDDSEALAYLRSVRTQAYAIPHVLVAKKAGPSPPPQHSEGNSEHGEHQHADRTIYEDGMGDFRGYYEDGAYVAAPDNRRAEEGEDDDERGTEEGRDGSESGSDRPRNSSVDEIRDAYFTSIADRYIALRKRLQANPPQSVLDALPATNPTEVGAWKRGVNTFQKWESRLRETEPLPAQIAAMHKDSVFRLIRVLLACKFLRAKTQVRERTSRWVWALLARLPDKGELDYMEVGWIRELGKRAVLLMVTLAELEVLREHYDVAGSSPEDEYQVDADVDDCFSDAPGQDGLIDADNPPTPEMTEEHTEETLHPETHVASSGDRRDAHCSTDINSDADAAPLHTPNFDNVSDVEMQLDSDMEDGEVVDGPPSPSHSDSVTDLETARARLLAQLDGDTADGGTAEHHQDSVSATPATQLAPTSQPTTAQDLAQQNVPPTSVVEGWEAQGEYVMSGDEEEEEDEDDVDYKRYCEPDRALVNERATLNMILTVAGEFYGQRDLLEFRDPFGGL